jgi:hypothetical protein
MKKTRLPGGGALTLAEGLNQANVCDWGEDSYIYFGVMPGIMRVPASGGKADVVAQPDPTRNESGFELPQLLPGAKLLLFNSSAAQARTGDQLVTVLNLETHEKKSVLEKVGYARYAPTAAASGHLVYWRNGPLFGVPFDLSHLTVGSPSPVAEGISGIITFGFFSFSDSGVLAYQPGGPGAFDTFVPAWVDRQGTRQPVAGIPPHLYNNVYAGGMQLSPNGKHAALEYLDLETGTSDLWAFDFARTAFIRKTFGGSHPAAVWSPDGKKLIYWATAKPSVANGEMKSAFTDGSGQPETLVANDASLYPGSISPDGKTLLGDQVDAFAEPGHAFALSLEDSDPKPKLLFGTQFNQRGAVFSPDGRWIAYTSNESGSDQVYVVPYPGPGGKWQVSANGGAFPRWNRNGRELFYREGTKMMAVDVETGSSFRSGTPKMLFDKPYQGTYDVAPDGKSFLMFQNAVSAQGQTSELRVVVNWFEELRQRAPAR